MKNIRYILYGHPVRPDQLGIIALPAAVVAVPVLIAFLGGAVIMDTERYLKLRYLLFRRDKRRLNYIRCVIRSLDREPDDNLINLLRAV